MKRHEIQIPNKERISFSSLQAAILSSVFDLLANNCFCFEVHGRGIVDFAAKIPSASFSGVKELFCSRRLNCLMAILNNFKSKKYFKTNRFPICSHRSFPSSFRFTIVKYVSKDQLKRNEKKSCDCLKSVHEEWLCIFRVLIFQ